VLPHDEQRFVTLGLLRGVPVPIVHTESPSFVSFLFVGRHIMKQRSSLKQTRMNAVLRAYKEASV
jgi:hypothetical protein